MKTCDKTIWHHGTARGRSHRPCGSADTRGHHWCSPVRARVVSPEGCTAVTRVIGQCHGSRNLFSARHPVVLKISNISIPLKFPRLGVYYTDACDLCLQAENHL